MNKKYVVCAYREWSCAFFKETLSRLPYEFALVDKKEALTENLLVSLQPAYIFFLDWSWIVPAGIYDNFRCVVFHAADLPDFRGGSPIQNQIIRGLRQTRLTAFFMDGGIDTGDIIMKADLSLEGHLRDIFKRMTDLMAEMIPRIIEGDFIVTKQDPGLGSAFKRRKPAESRLEASDFDRPLEYLHDFIRMLEDPYPNAFVDLGGKRLIFKEAELLGEERRLLVKAEIVDAPKRGEAP